jgi:hypothetical protein
MPATTPHITMNAATRINARMVHPSPTGAFARAVFSNGRDLDGAAAAIQARGQRLEGGLRARTGFAVQANPTICDGQHIGRRQQLPMSDA